jgi:hypothetical protein
VIVMDRIQQSSNSRKALDVRVFDDVLGEETELVDEELLGLLVSE